MAAGLWGGSGKVAKVSTLAATSVVIADMVGIGVFTSLGFQVKDITSGFSLMMLWFVGGVIALCGAFCYAELAAMFPRSSGEYNLLTRSYHPVLGFLAGWLSATVGFSAAVALAAMAFGEYFKSIVPVVPTLVSGLLVVWVVSLFHLRGVQHGSRFHIVSTALKIVLIVAFIVAGFLVPNPQPVSFLPTAADPFLIISAPFAISLVFVLYSYSGWNASVYIAGEMRNPHRALPRSLVFGTVIVTILYVGLNAVFLYTTPLGELSGQIDVGVIAGKHIFGDLGGRAVGGLICIGLVSAISAMMWIGPRVTMTMGEDFPALRMFSRVSQNGVPVAALVCQMIVSSLLLFTQSFEAVLDFIQFSLTFCSFLTVLGVMKLRYTHPHLPRPYKAWGYPVTPIIFLLVNGFVMFYLITTRPAQSLAGFFMMAAGLLIYATTMFLPAQTAAQKVPVNK